MQEVLDNKYCTNGPIDLEYETMFEALHQAELFTMMGFEVTYPVDVGDHTFSIRVTK